MVWTTDSSPEHASPLDAPVRMMEANHFSSKYREVDLSLRDLAIRVQFATVAEKSASTSPGLFFGRAEQRPMDKTVRGDQRLYRSAIVLDLEEGESSVPHDVPQRVEALPWAALLYASPSYTRSAPRWRLVVPVSAPLSADDTPRVTGYVAQRLGAYEWLDWTCREPARRYYAPFISDRNPEADALSEDGMPYCLSEGVEHRWLAAEDVPGDYALPVRRRSPERVPDRGGRPRRDPRTSDSQFGVFSRCYDLDALIEMSGDWPSGRIPYAHSTPTMWYWTGAACDDAEPADEPSLSQIEPGVPLYKDHAASSPQAGRTSTAFDIASSWMYGPLARQDGRPDYDAGFSSDTPPQDRPSSKLFWDFISENPAMFAAMADETFAEVPQELQEHKDAADVPSLAEMDAWSVKRVWGELSPLDLKTKGRKLDNPADQELIARRDPVLRRLVRDARSGQVGWCAPPPGREVDDQDRAQARKRNMFPRRPEDATLARVYVEKTYACRQVTADIAKKIFDMAVSGARSVDAFRDYLDSLPKWDGVSRLGSWHAGVVDNPDDRLALRRFVISLVARTRRPGCEVGWIPVLVGAQDTLKTTTLQWLVGGRCYRMNSLDEPHLMERMVRYPLVIWDEFHLAQSDRDPYVNRVKDLITGSSDMWHENYSTSESEAERMWVMAATTNSFDIPSSMEGARRFMPVRIASDGGPRGEDGGPLWRTEALREQVLAEAVAAFEAGEPFTLSDPAGRAAQQRALARVREDAPELEDVARFLSQRWPSGWCAADAKAREIYRRQRAETPELEVRNVPGELTLLPVVTVKVLLQDALGLPPSQCASQRVRVRVKAVLKELGWAPGKRRIGGVSTAVWVRPKADPVAEATAVTAEAAADA